MGAILMVFIGVLVLFCLYNTFESSGIMREHMEPRSKTRQSGSPPSAPSAPSSSSGRSYVPTTYGSKQPIRR